MNIQELEAEVRAAADARLPELRDARCLLAASGGADSAALVALLVEANVIDPRRSLVGHFDHRLRGDEASQRDRAAVEALCARYGLPLAVDVWEAPQGGEAAAREARYRALARLASQHAARAIVTGHTADDQAETVVMRALRGAGLHGLAGMAADAPLAHTDSMRVWRPLLRLTRAQTRAYCVERGLPFHDDPSNEDPRLLRNRVRHEIIPAMSAAAGSDVRPTLLAIAGAARRAADAADVCAARFVPAQSTATGIALPRAPLVAVPHVLLAHVFRLAVTNVAGDARDLERRHYALMARAVHAETGSTFMLPRGLVLTVDANALTLSLGAIASRPVDPCFVSELPFEGSAGDWHVRVVPAGAASLADGGVEVRLPAGAILRARRPGDRVRTRAGGKKLGDWYTDRKIPQRARDAAPVIACGDQVLWTPWGPLGEMPHGVAWRIACRPNPPSAALTPREPAGYDVADERNARVL